MPNAKPYLQMACICENILLDKDGVASLIRIVDKFQAHVPKELPPGIPAGFPLNIFIRLASGGFKGLGKVRIQGRRPDGTLGGKVETDVESPGGNAGMQIKTGFHVITPQSGVWDLTKWDQASWSTNIIPYTRWQLATGIGHYGALRVSTSSTAADIRYYATDYVFEPGGIL